jgi:outer membrane protein OmpA-like peptidoglycan-associated protein
MDLFFEGLLRFSPHVYCASMLATENYDSLTRKWVIRALILSLLFHAGLIAVFRMSKLERFSVYTERLVPRAFAISRADIDPKLLESDLEPESSAPKKEQPDLSQIQIPDEKPAVENVPQELRAAPSLQELVNPIVNEKPRVDATNLQSLAKMQESASREIQNEIDMAPDNLIKDRPRISTKSLLDLNKTGAISSPGSGSDAEAMAAASGRLDQLLGRGIQRGDAPLSLPGGALFEFNSVELKPEAIEQLKKLGLLIKKNPRITFSIEGHSDSFGDDATNNALSLARAESVRQWLVENMGVSPANIQTKGFGKTKLQVTPRPYDQTSQAAIDAEKMRQQPNRRVEIVFRFPKTE